MKTKSLFVCMMLVGLASCSGSKEEPFTGFDENTSTNTRQTDVEYPFYYFKGEKIGIELSDTKSYVLFREKDKEVLLNNLSERGVVFTNSILGLSYRLKSVKRVMAMTNI